MSQLGPFEILILAVVGLVILFIIIIILRSRGG
jgi:hypothetical protein